jgi:cytochrome c oxidase assembly factor CtaG
MHRVTPSLIVAFYDVYLKPSSLLGVDPLADQRIAGLIMWVPAGLVLTLLGIALFAAWLGEAESRGASQRDLRYTAVS